MTLLGSLPQGYSTLVTALEARENVSLGYVQQALIHEEQKLNGEFKQSSATGGTDGRRASALVGKHKTVLKCYGCGEAGHLRRDCPNNKEGYHKKSDHKAKPAEEKSSDKEPDGDGAFVASAKSSGMERWLIDSGASSHMTHERKLLTDYQKFEKPEKVCLGNGRTVEAVGVGNVHLNMLFKESEPKKSVMYHVL